MYGVDIILSSIQKILFQKVQEPDVSGSWWGWDQRESENIIEFFFYIRTNVSQKLTWKVTFSRLAFLPVILLYIFGLKYIFFKFFQRFLLDFVVGENDSPLDKLTWLEEPTFSTLRDARFFTHADQRCSFEKACHLGSMTQKRTVRGSLAFKS